MFKKISLMTLAEDAVFWLVWSIVTIAGYAVAWVIFGIISISCSCSAADMLIYITKREPKFIAALMGLIIGFPYGFFIGWIQRIVLRKRIEQSNIWVRLTAFGAMLGWAVTALIPGSYDPRNFFSLVIYPMAISAIAMAVFQSWALQPALIDSLWWVLAAVVPWIFIEFADFLSSFVGVTNFEVPLMLFSAGIIAAAAVYVFGQTEQRKFNALTLGGLWLVVMIIWGLLAKNSPSPRST